MARADSCCAIERSEHRDCGPSEHAPEDGTTTCSDSTVVLPKGSAQVSVPALNEEFEGSRQFFSDMLAALLREEPSRVPPRADSADPMPEVTDHLHVSRPIRGPSD